MEVIKIQNNEYKFVFNDTIGKLSSLGKIFQTELMKIQEVAFVGYYCPHPLESKMILIIKTNEKTPREVLNMACDNIIKKLIELSNALDN